MHSAIISSPSVDQRLPRPEGRSRYVARALLLDVAVPRRIRWPFRRLTSANARWRASAASASASDDDPNCGLGERLRACGLMAWGTTVGASFGEATVDGAFLDSDGMGDAALIERRLLIERLRERPRARARGIMGRGGEYGGCPRDEAASAAVLSSPTIPRKPTALLRARKRLKRTGGVGLPTPLMNHSESVCLIISFHGL